jgi:hypothetical protein
MAFEQPRGEGYGDDTIGALSWDYPIGYLV